MAACRISFVIPAHNEERHIGATLASIHRSAMSLGEPYEIVVADDASTDRTAALARQHGARVVAVSHHQIAATRNAGARAASGDWLVFVDADTQVNPAAVAAAIQSMRQGAVGGGAGIRFDGAVPFYARLALPVMLLVFRMVGIAAGCFLFCTRAAFDAVGGFDEAYFGAEEIFLSRSLRNRGRFVVLRQTVLTSGRKLRTYSGWELLVSTLRFAVGGTHSVKKREGLDIWYAERRADPEDAPAKDAGKPPTGT